MVGNVAILQSRSIINLVVGIGIDFGVTLLLVAVEALDELLDVRNAVGPRIMLPRRVHLRVSVHLEDRDWEVRRFRERKPQRGNGRVGKALVISYIWTHKGRTSMLVPCRLILRREHHPCFLSLRAKQASRQQRLSSQDDGQRAAVDHLPYIPQLASYLSGPREIHRQLSVFDSSR